jgi:hypothetical protein
MYLVFKSVFAGKRVAASIGTTTELFDTTLSENGWNKLPVLKRVDGSMFALVYNRA